MILIVRENGEIVNANHDGIYRISTYAWRCRAVYCKSYKRVRTLGLDVDVVCNEKGNGEFSGLSPTNERNSQILLKLVGEVNPDIVHIQFEPGMYGLLIDPKNPKNSGTYLDNFYRKCSVPITTTFHSGYNLSQWMSIASLIKKSGKIGRLGIPLRFLIRFWKYFLNYKAFNNLNKEKLCPQ